MKRLTIWMTEAGKFSPRDIRIREIHFEDDRTLATVIPEMRRKGAWRSVKPARWRRRDDEWFLMLK